MVAYLGFHLNNIRRAIRRAIRFILLLLRLFLLAFDSALHFRYDALRAHAHRQTLLQSALLTLASHIHINLARVAVLAGVDGILGYAPPEEPFAAFACQRIVVIT